MKKHFFTLLMVTMVLLGGCQADNPAGSPIPGVTSTATASQWVISEQEAADRAVRIAKQSRPEIEAPSADPHIREIKQTSLGAALQEMHTEPQDGDNLSQPVFLVKLSGLWFVGIPGPGITPSPYLTYYVVLDAQTGIELKTSVQQ